MAREAESG